MKLFDILPDYFFQLLTGSNKRLYAEAVLSIYELSKDQRFGIRLDVLRDLLQEIVESYQALGEELVTDDENEGLGESPAVEQATERQFTLEEAARMQANSMLRRLQTLGWIDVEVREHFQQYVVLPHYSSRMLALFQELCEARTVEYQRFAFVTFQLLTGEEARRRPGFAVREAERMSEQLQQELVTLYNNMKHHMEEVVRQTSIQDVLDHHFDVYKSQIIDVSYHRLKTSDHVSRYRFQILQTVQEWILNADWLAEAAEDALKNDQYASLSESEQGVRRSLYTIEAIYGTLDEIFYQIDLRHNQYLRSSYDRARYLSQHHQGLDRQLADALERLSQIRKRLPEEVEADLWPELFALRQSSLLDESSLYTPRRKRAPHQPEKHVTVPVPEELKEELRQANLARMRKAITRKKVDAYVQERLYGRSEMELAELVPGNVEEFLMLTYVYLYGQDGSSAFRVERSGERTILHIGGYRFHNHRIVRTAGRS
ncbi:Wadjet anti-phage system protein JetA family protein [Cohnella soli]|uniref:Wadjet anti-phage system protein JetA family protein n=1 Tax=Cohnella soli TaxID=425005 RepID=A0ABW0HVV3_9BACL